VRDRLAQWASPKAVLRTRLRKPDVPQHMYGCGLFAGGDLTLHFRGTIVPLQAPARPPPAKIRAVEYGGVLREAKILVGS